MDPNSTLSRVIRTGASELYTQMSDEYLVKVARTSDHLEALDRALTDFRDGEAADDVAALALAPTASRGGR
jgi:hypothetical protein